MIIQKLLLLESEAQEAMRTLEKEQVLLAKKAEEDLAHRITKLESEQNAAIKLLEQNTEAETMTAIAKIKMDYKQKESNLIRAFAANRNTWEDEIVQEILHIDPPIKASGS